MRTFCVTVLCCIAFSALASDSADAPKIDGLWKWSFTMPDGYKVEPRAKLKREGDTLTGTSRFRSGAPAPIQDGKVNGDTISWSVVREHDGRKVTTRYEGKLKGDTINGTISSDWAGEAKTYSWEAKRTQETPEGEWKWEVAFGEFRTSYSTKLKLDGRKVSGKVKSRDREYDIKEGRWKDGELTFTVERERDGVDIVSKYRGKIDGDTIKGAVETAFGSAEPRSADWLATRVDD
jgi:hypothetical protein